MPSRASQSSQTSANSSRPPTGGKPTSRMLNGAWRRARTAAGLPQVRVHDLKHTLGRRLRAAGVSFEDRQDLLGRRSARKCASA